MGIQLSMGNDVKLLQSTLIRGEGAIDIGSKCSFGYNLGGYFLKGGCEMQPRYKNSKIIIGDNVHINNNLFICCAKSVIIEKNSLIGEGVMIIDHDAHGISIGERHNSIGKVKSVYISENAWIGSRVTILSGTQIGRNSIVGAGSVVKGNFPDNVIIGGNPAKIIKNIE